MRYLLALGGLLLLVAGCQLNAPQAEQNAEVETLYHFSQCNYAGTAPQASWVGTQTALAEVWRQIHGARLQPPPAPAIDFRRHAVVIIRMGQRPTAGYGLRLADDSLRVSAEAARVVVAWENPPGDRLQAQVVTSPCLLLSVPREGYQRLEVVDRTGTVRAVAERTGSE